MCRRLSYCSERGKFSMGERLTHCLAPTVMHENQLRISTLGHSESPSNTIGDVFSAAWNESKLGFHHFDFLNACH